MTHLLKLKQDHHRTMRPLRCPIDRSAISRWPVDPLTRWPAVRRALRTVRCPSVCILPSNGISADLGCRNAIYWNILREIEILWNLKGFPAEVFPRVHNKQHVHVHGCTRSKLAIYSQVGTVIGFRTDVCRRTHFCSNKDAMQLRSDQQKWFETHAS